MEPSDAWRTTFVALTSKVGLYRVFGEHFCMVTLQSLPTRCTFHSLFCEVDPLQCEKRWGLYRVSGEHFHMVTFQSLLIRCTFHGLFCKVDPLQCEKRWGLYRVYCKVICGANVPRVYIHPVQVLFVAFGKISKEPDPTLYPEPSDGPRYQEPKTGGCGQRCP